MSERERLAKEYFLKYNNDEEDYEPDTDSEDFLAGYDVAMESIDLPLLKQIQANLLSASGSFKSQGNSLEADFYLARSEELAALINRLTNDKRD